MEQGTGGHYLDTGDGPVQMDPPPVRPEPGGVEAPAAKPALKGRATEHPMTVAYREYVTHCRGCLQCRGSVFRCGTGDDLWDAYLAVR